MSEQADSRRSEPNAEHRSIATDLHIGMRLRTRRLVLGMQAGEFAQAAGITVAQLEAFEDGIERIDASRLFQFAEYMSIPVSWFFDGLDAEAEALFGGRTACASAVSARAAEKEGLELLEFYYHSIQDPTVRRSLLEVARALAEPKVSRQVR